MLIIRGENDEIILITSVVIAAATRRRGLRRSDLYIYLTRQPHRHPVARAVSSVQFGGRFAGRFAGRRSAWLDKDISIHLFQSLSLDASSFAPRDYSLCRMSRGQAVTAWRD